MISKITNTLHHSCKLVISSITALLAQTVANADLNNIHLPEGTGISAAIISENNVKFLQFGNPNFNEHSRFEIGSVTKTFTALAVALHNIDHPDFLDTELSSIITEIKNNKIASITPRLLSTHTSGLPRLSASTQLKAIFNTSDPYKHQTAQILIQNLNMLKQRSTKQIYTYSNFGYAVLGLALEKDIKQPYSTIISNKILKPLKMNQSFVHYTPENQKTVVTGYDEKATPTSVWHFKASAPAGAIKSSAYDLSLYIQAYLSPNDTTLSLAMANTIKTQHKINEQLSIGLGWHIQIHEDQKIYWHNGGTGGYRSFIGFNPTTRKGIVLLSNYAGIKQLDQTGLEILSQ
ncbi:Beta-lactamase [Poriferisphaera corsica]|uniref:Beta-lactamase n=1 Tax=Poriferisphaera corsica TaxID=2528020 RepID=A0A517YW27_9BACT|nr:serine hydrolase domain-containing protein [Poriferisphaera corsica]QDU34418.1 Beta-lactamase [Poriferisphaera corsica]